MRSEKEGFQTTQRPPQEVSRRPRTLQGLEVGANLAPRGVPKSIQNRSKSELGSLQNPRPPPRFQNGPQTGFQIVAKSTSKSIQNSFTTDAKCACKLFLRHAGMQVRQNSRVISNEKRAEPNARKSAMSCSVLCIRYPRALAMPSPKWTPKKTFQKQNETLTFFYLFGFLHNFHL